MTRMLAKLPAAALATIALASVAAAQEAGEPEQIGKGLAIGLACGLAVIGGAMGIGKIGAAAVESIARQPEAGGDIGGRALILAALIEGATLFGVVGGVLSLFLF